MAWGDLKDKVDVIMKGLEFKPALETFNVETMPALDSMTNTMYCVLANDLSPNTTFTDKADRFYPHCKFSVNVLFNLYNGNQDQYDAAVTSEESIIASIINPGNYSVYTRIIEFRGATNKLLHENWLIATINFEAEYILAYQ